MRWNVHGPLLLAAFAAVALIGSVLPAAAQDVAAVVNGDSITNTKLTKACLARTGKLVLNQLIDEVLIRQEAKKHNVTISTEELDERIVGLRERVESLQERTGLDWVGWLTAQDVSEDVLRGVYEVDLMVHKIVAQQVEVIDQEVQEYYTQNKDSVLKRPARAHVTIIAVDTEVEAKDLLRQIQEGADFAELAKEHSLDPTSKQNGGDIGWVTNGAVAEAAMKLEPGQTAGPIPDQLEIDGQPKTIQFLVRLIEKKPEQIPTYEDAKEGIREAIFDLRMRTKIPQWFAAVKKEANIEVKVDFGTEPSG